MREEMPDKQELIRESIMRDMSEWVMTTGFDGTIIEFIGDGILAHDGAAFETETELNIYDNVQIEAGGKLFCKVVEKRDDGGALVRFTSIPALYETWLKAETN